MFTISEVVEVSNLDELNAVLAANDDVVIDFSALAWCVPCQRLKPHYDEAARNLENTVFVYVDADSMDEEFRNVWPVMSVPTVVRVKDGVKSDVKGRTVVQLLRELS